MFTWGLVRSARSCPPPVWYSAWCRGTAGRTAAAELWFGSWGSRGPGRQTHRTCLLPKILLKMCTFKWVCSRVLRVLLAPNMFTILPHFGPCTCGCKRHPHLVLGLLCDAVVVMKNLVQTGLQQLMQGGPRQGMPPDSVHLQAQLEQQRLDEPGGLEKTRAQKDLHRIVN